MTYCHEFNEESPSKAESVGFICLSMLLHVRHLSSFTTTTHKLVHAWTYKTCVEYYKPATGTAAISQVLHYS